MRVEEGIFRNILTSILLLTTASISVAAQVLKYGSSDPMRSRGWMASIFPYENPCTECSCDYQSIQEGFVRDRSVWGPSVQISFGATE